MEIVEHDAITGQTVIRLANDEEIAAYEISIKSIDQMEVDRLAALEARKAPLRRVGLTDDEINTVLGL